MMIRIPSRVPTTTCARPKRQKRQKPRRRPVHPRHVRHPTVSTVRARHYLRFVPARRAEKYRRRGARTRTRNSSRHSNRRRYWKSHGHSSAAAVRRRRVRHGCADDDNAGRGVGVGVVIRRVCRGLHRGRGQDRTGQDRTGQDRRTRGEAMCEVPSVCVKYFVYANTITTARETVSLYVP